MGTPAVTTDAASIAAIDMERTLTQLPFWSSLTEREMDTLRRSAFVRHYKKGAFIHSSDNECLGMLFILSGEIRTYLLSDEGREVTLFRLYPGERAVRGNLPWANHYDFIAETGIACIDVIVGKVTRKEVPVCRNTQSISIPY